MKNNIRRAAALLLLLSLIFALGSCFTEEKPIYADSLADVPEFSGSAYVIINGNRPFFTDEEIVTESYESYSPLDGLGRCGAATACIGVDLMPTTDREGSLTSVTPSGWINAEYDIVSGGYLYNRAHLIGWQLTAETTNERNLITGTRFMNVDGMLPFENKVADYLKEERDCHVMYRVTPIFNGNDLVASGVLMEAYSVEDGGDGVCFCVYVYNNQPGVRINYATGESKLDDGVPFPEPDPTIPDGEVEYKYVINISTEKIHTPSCSYAKSMKESNKEYSNLTLEELEGQGYDRCGSCLGN